MTTTNTAGLKTTYPYTGPDEGVARYQCEECGGWERADKRFGRIRHSKRCDSQVQAAQATVVVPQPADPIRTFAANVRRTGMTCGRDEDVLTAVRRGYLSESAAMNTDD